jgi:hypothetical protein
MRMAMPDGTIAHAELELGGSVIMIGDEMPGGVDPSLKTLGGSPVALFVYVEDVDDVFQRALAAGAKAVQEPENHFYGAGLESHATRRPASQGPRPADAERHRWSCEGLPGELDRADARA